MNENPLLKLESFGQSVWMDFISRRTLSSGQLNRLIDEDGVSGVTSNPSIFEKAFSASHDYDDAIRDLGHRGKSVDEIYDTIVVEDIRRTADLFRPLYDRVRGRDGFVSLEVSPHLAHDTAGSVAEARRLWAAVNRPNVMIKIPGTIQGLPAIQQLIGEGINVNITLLFGLPRYRRVIEAYLAGLETLAERGRALDRVASVASFFLSRIDVLVDPKLERIMPAGGANAELANGLHGQVAIASAKVAYKMYQDVFTDARFLKLAAKGARVQRLLWASTSTKNPAYSDVKYIEPLIGADTINTLPLETIDAYRDHGDPALRLEQDLPKATWVLDHLAQLGVDLDAVTQQLEDEGVEKFSASFDALASALQEKRDATLAERVKT